MSKTILWIRDGDTAAAYPVGDSGPMEFAVYNDAMSYARWMSVQTLVSTNTLIAIWNYNGGSGYWLNGAFTSVENQNYPS